jgi:arsenite methyltransferase
MAGRRLGRVREFDSSRSRQGGRIQSNNDWGLMAKSGRLVVLLFAVLCSRQTLVAQVEHQHHPPASASEYIKSLEDPGRDEWQQPEKVVAELQLKPGDSVADIGAGSGYFAVRFARAVAPSGKIFAVDIDQQMLDYVNRRAQEEHIDNIQTVLADPHDPKLAAASVDLIFICDTLHHISDRGKYYPLLARALKPGGRLVNIDFFKRLLPFGPPVEMKISEESVIDEVKPAGFRFLKKVDFLKYQYFLIFEH